MLDKKNGIPDEKNMSTEEITNVRGAENAFDMRMNIEENGLNEDDRND